MAIGLITSNYLNKYKDFVASFLDLFQLVSDVKVIMHDFVNLTRIEHSILVRYINSPADRRLEVVYRSAFNHQDTYQESFGGRTLPH